MWVVAIDFYIMSFFDESDYYLWLVGMIIEGFFIGGPYMLISAALASDLVCALFKSHHFNHTFLRANLKA